MPFINRPALICDRCREEIKPGASVILSKIRTYTGVNFASTLDQQYASSWPMFKDVAEDDTKYEHFANCKPFTAQQS